MNKNQLSSLRFHHYLKVTHECLMFLLLPRTWYFRQSTLVVCFLYSALGGGGEVATKWSQKLKASYNDGNVYLQMKLGSSNFDMLSAMIEQRLSSVRDGFD